ncbi:MAG: HipA domain-containing protein [Cytophagales bacterium]|uniref:HipA domain-containing protein n=1 Tax=Cyclobacterium marinum TaxID=104 RepID=UPI0011EC8A6F|nr:HipA domain-containing protein [Cyclobacterium marinum]MBI0401698.1 HipA domain-containing protein [Cyclobacterium marinum]MBR9775063.1 HipA domain-containing protein [Cytophagales bacterium]
MSKRNCLYCYQKLDGGEIDFHSKCSKKIFGKPLPPLLEYTSDQMLELAEKIIKSQSTVPGVQAKLSLGLQTIDEKDKPQKLTIMGFWGEYILKPPSEHYESLPELEDLTMHLAAIAGIRTVPHSLIRLKSGELSYITKRIDRKGKQKFHMEDMCQLTDRLTESKYRGSYEQIGKALVQFSSNPGFDIINFFEQVVFCFLTGNNDMHLKNFSLFKDPEKGYNLSPAYDMIAAQLVVEGDSEELALTLNGKKKKITRKDIEAAMARFEIDQKAFDNIFLRFKKAIPKWHAFVEKSFLTDEMKAAYQVMIGEKSKQIRL